MQSGGQLHSNVFYNGTVEVVEPSGILSGENAFLALLAIALLGLLGYWAYGQVQKLTKVSDALLVKAPDRVVDSNWCTCCQWIFWLFVLLLVLLDAKIGL
jgi:hypothetical protein